MVPELLGCRAMRKFAAAVRVILMAYMVAVGALVVFRGIDTVLHG